MTPKHDPPGKHSHDGPAGDEHPDPPTPGQPDEGIAGGQIEGYLFVVHYGNDAQRKRAEYLFDNWNDGTIQNPDGLVRLAENTDGEALHEELLVKFRAEQIDAYALSEQPAPESPETRTIERTLGADRETVESFVQYLLSRKKGTQNGENEYEVYTRHGRADVTVSLTEAEDEMTVEIRLRGHPPALEPLSSYLHEELDAFEASC